LNILEEHEGLQVCSVAWFPAGPLLASVAYDGSPPPCEAAVFLWHTETWKLLAVVRTLMSDTHSAWHPAFPLLAAGGQQKGDIDILNLEELID
jgi:WD40 repeat protein